MAATISTARIRDERPDDAAAVRRVNELAFPGGGEAAIVEALREAGAVTLSLIAEIDGDVAGHILFSPVILTTAAGPTTAVGLGPMAVVPDLQRSGVGTQLVRAGLERLRASGHTAVVVLGHPGYYPRFGFERASAHGIRWELDCPDEAFMVLELEPGALRGLAGVVAYRPELTPG
jgi:putative acetyltransferase